MVKLAPADFVVLGAFFAVLLTLGFSARIKENTSLQLVAAGRKLTLPLFLATLVTTWYGGVLGTWPVQNHGEPAVLFCFIYLFMAAYGGGAWSLDALIWGKRNPA